MRLRPPYRITRRNSAHVVGEMAASVAGAVVLVWPVGARLGLGASTTMRLFSCHLQRAAAVRLRLAVRHLHCTQSDPKSEEASG